MITGHAGRPAKKRAFPKNLRPRPNCCDNAVGGPRARPRVVERNETRVTLTQVKRASRMWHALVLLALTRTTLSRAGIPVKGASANTWSRQGPQRASESAWLMPRLLACGRRGARLG